MDLILYVANLESRLTVYFVLFMPTIIGDVTTADFGSNGSLILHLPAYPHRLLPG